MNNGTSEGKPTIMEKHCHSREMSDHAEQDRIPDMPAVWLNGRPVEVHATDTADFVLVSSSDGDAELTLQPPVPVTQAEVRPRRLGVMTEVRDGTVRCRFSRIVNAMVEMPGTKPLLVFALPERPDAPRPGDPGVRYFGGGSVHDAGVLRLESGETLWIERGTVLRATVVADGAEHVRIGGGGILDGTRPGAHPMVILSRCRHCRIEDVTLVHPTNWMVVLGGCEDVAVENLHEIGEVVCSDGVDIVGSSDIEVRGSFLMNNDDCVVVKAMRRGYSHLGEACWDARVRGIRIRGCSLYNLGAGNATEIGFELRTDLVEDIVFEDLDILAAHRNAAVFSIHDGDRALVRGVRYRDIRVEHYWDKLVDIRILRSRYTKDDEPGRIEDIAFEHIRCVPNVFNTPSLIGGFDAKHRVRGVRFDDVRLGDRVVASADDLELFTRRADDIVFAPEA